MACRDAHQTEQVLTGGRSLNNRWQPFSSAAICRKGSLEFAAPTASYEHNALLMNVAGQGFVNVGYLMNVAFEFDSRAAVSGDGRVDLIVENKNLSEIESRLFIMRNSWNKGGHWIGVHLRQTPGTASPIGARVTTRLPGGRVLLQHNVAGHSVWAQHANTVHFGLGEVDTVAAIDVQWPDGSSSAILEPAIDEYHFVTSAN